VGVFYAKFETLTLRRTRAVSVGNPREFLQAEKEDQEMAEASPKILYAPAVGKNPVGLCVPLLV
jgi:hypothetical protein